MLKNLPLRKRRFVIVALLVWLLATFWSFATINVALFSAMGSFSLCISFAVFLTDRHVSQETRRQWDSEILTQSRMMWRYYQNAELGRGANDPTSLAVLRDQITINFNDLLAAKAAERGLDRFRTELFFTLVGTLQWGFGGIVMEFIYGG